MITREVKLHRGLKVGEDGPAMTATIREETLDDELKALESGLSGARLHRTIAMDRVVKLGLLERPTPELLRKLARVDWELIEMAILEMDEALGDESGLTAKAAERGRGGPGGAAPGDA